MAEEMIDTARMALRHRRVLQFVISGRLQRIAESTWTAKTRSYATRAKSSDVMELIEKGWITYPQVGDYAEATAEGRLAWGSAFNNAQGGVTVTKKDHGTN